MKESEREVLRLINELWRDIQGGRGGRRNDAVYFASPDGWRFYYTPWKDDEGYYYSWRMKPIGRGSRSGKPQRWKRVGKVVKARTRKTARDRALRAYRRRTGPD